MRALLTVALLSLAAAASAADYTFTGFARDLDSGQLIYVEQHQVRDGGAAGESREVLYRLTEDSAPFARKTLRYGANRAVPEFEFDCTRSGFREGLTRTGGKLRVSARRGRDAPERHRDLAVADVGVADAGFDEFVRANWARLASGEAMTKVFLVPSRLEAMRFRVRKVDEVDIGADRAMVIRLSLAGALGWILPDIDVSYRQRDQRLLRYRGVTNIRDAAGKPLQAQIDFPDSARTAN